MTEQKRITRSGCPVNCIVEFFGDKWSLLIVRELMGKHVRTFSQLMSMKERISTGTLATRICKLQELGIIDRQSSPDDKRSADYSLTQKGKDLEPMMVEMVLWAADHEMPELPKNVIDNLRQTRMFDPRYDCD